MNEMNAKPTPRTDNHYLRLSAQIDGAENDRDELLRLLQDIVSGYEQQSVKNSIWHFAKSHEKMAFSKAISAARAALAKARSQS